jgi:multicomponent Na+:H+ antiporter subunit A
MPGIIAPIGLAILFALAAPFLHAARPRLTGPALGTGALALCGWYLSFAPGVSSGETPDFAFPWIPSLGADAAFRLDGLSLLFAALITGVGGLVLMYASEYMKGNDRLGRLYMLLLLFMGSMLGLVLADNLLLVFVFWELTGIVSYFLIGFESGRPQARAAALQALLVTGAGGLALLAGFILLGAMSGTYSVSGILAADLDLAEHPLYTAALILIVAGAFTKSAQVPFHFWLPAAMEAPTPVSAYLHSSTMVKAGIYLLARLMGVLGETPQWHSVLSIAGASTMLLGAFLSLTQSDLKRMLAYSTVSALGTLVLLLGLGTAEAARAVCIFVLVHALYKGALFLVAGAVAHEAGTRDLDRLGGLWRGMPVTAAAAVLAGLSMAGLPPLLGFLSKELIYEAKLGAPDLAPLIVALGVGGNILIAALAGIFCLRVFFGDPFPGRVRETRPAMLAGPAALSMLGVVLGLTPGFVDTHLIAPAVAAIHPEPSLSVTEMWMGLDPVLALSAATILSAGILVLKNRPLLRLLHTAQAVIPFSAERLYSMAFEGVKSLAAWQTRLLQSASLRIQVVIAFATLAMFLAPGLLRAAGAVADAGTIYAHEVLVVGAMTVAALTAAAARSRFVAVIAVGVVGYGMTILFALLGAPDLSMTQLTVETLTLVVFLLVLLKLPSFKDYSSRGRRLRDAAIAGAAGIAVTLALLATGSSHERSALAEFFGKTSLLLANGRNVVNVILVDFRALDTLGEITVLAIAGLGVFALLRIFVQEDQP